MTISGKSRGAYELAAEAAVIAETLVILPSLEGRDFNKEDKIEALGLDSLDMVELSMALDESLQIEIPDNDLRECKTIGDLVKVVADQLERKP